MAHVIPFFLLYVLFCVLRNDSEPTVHQRLTGETETCELNQKQVGPDRRIILCTEELMLILDSLKCKYVEMCGLYADWICVLKELV